MSNRNSVFLFGEARLNFGFVLRVELNRLGVYCVGGIVGGGLWRGTGEVLQVLFLFFLLLWDVAVHGGVLTRGRGVELVAREGGL